MRTDAKAEGDEAEEGAMSAQGSLAHQLLLMEEQTFDAEEDDQQFKLRHGQLINYRAEEASTVLDKTKIKPTRVAASAGDNIPTLLIQVPKGMYFPENGWRDVDTLKVLKERVTCHKLDVSRFFIDEDILKSYTGVCDALCVCVKLCENMLVCLGYFGLITADVPYGDQKDHGLDPPWSDGTVTSIVAGMWLMARPKSTVIIQVGGVEQCVQWRRALRSAGFTLEQEPRTVCPSRSDSSIKYHTHPGRSRVVVSTNHFWVVAFKGLSSISEVKGAPFGVFDQYSYLNATVLSGCPMTRASDRLASKDGEYVRYFEKHIGESLELLARSVLSFLFLSLFASQHT